MGLMLTFNKAFYGKGHIRQPPSDLAHCIFYGRPLDSCNAHFSRGKKIAAGLAAGAGAI